MAVSRKGIGWKFDEEFKMTRHTKVNLVGSIFLIAGLYCSIAYAAPEVKEKSHHSFAITSTEMQVSSTANSISYSYAYPSITSEIFKETNKTHTPKLIQLYQQPLLGIQVVDFAHLVPNKFEKKNTIFEFAAKFNDALQKMLTYVGFSSTSATPNNETIGEKNQHKKISLIAKHEKHSLKTNCTANKS